MQENINRKVELKNLLSDRATGSIYNNAAANLARSRNVFVEKMNFEKNKKVTAKVTFL